jgi:hypothetical protein
MLVHVRREAQRRVYAHDPGPLAELDAWLEPYRRLWSERLRFTHMLEERGASMPS